MELRELANFVIEHGRVDENVDGGWIASLEAEMEYEAEERGMDAAGIREWIYRVYGDDTTADDTTADDTPYTPCWGGVTKFAEVHGGGATVYANWEGDGGSLQFCNEQMPPHCREAFESEAALKSRMSEISDEWFAISEED
jgi:hypothetical protein